MPNRPSKKLSNKEEGQPTGKVDPKVLEVSNKIQQVLEEAGMALQPFLSYSEYGTFPRVRLVDIPKDNGETGNKEEVGASEDKDGATEPTES